MARWSWLWLGCVACGPPERPSELGPAVLALYLGNDTEVLDILHLRSGTVLAFATEVDTEGLGPRDAIRRADVEASTDGVVVRATPLGKGAYVTGVADARDLAPTGEVDVRLARDDLDIGLSGPTPPVLVLPYESLLATAGVDLEVALPDRWWRSHPFVVTQVLDLDGRIVWTDRPTELEGWLDTLADPPRPRSVVIPGRVLEPGAYVLASCFLQQMDDQLVFDGPINEPFSGLWAGTARFVSLQVVQ